MIRHIIEYGLIVSKSSSRSRPRSGPQKVDVSFTAAQRNHLILHYFIKQFAIPLRVHDLPKNRVNKSCGNPSYGEWCFVCVSGRYMCVLGCV